MCVRARARVSVCAGCAALLTCAMYVLFNRPINCSCTPSFNEQQGTGGQLELFSILKHGTINAAASFSDIGVALGGRQVPAHVAANCSLPTVLKDTDGMQPLLHLR